MIDPDSVIAEPPLSTSSIGQEEYDEAELSITSIPLKAISPMTQELLVEP